MYADCTYNRAEERDDFEFRVNNGGGCIVIGPFVVEKYLPCPFREHRGWSRLFLSLARWLRRLGWPGAGKGNRAGLDGLDGPELAGAGSGRL